MTESMCSVFPNLDAHKEMFLNRAGARQPWTKGRVIAAHRHGRYARLAESENRQLLRWRLCPLPPGSRAARHVKVSECWMKGFWAEVRVGGEHLRLFRRP